MAFDYTGLQAVAQTLMGEFGQSTTVRVQRALQNNADVPTDVTVTNSDTSATAVVTTFDESQIDGSMVEANDRRVLIAGADLDTAPEPGNTKILIGRVTYSVINVRTVSPGGTVLLYIIQARA